MTKFWLNSYEIFIDGKSINNKTSQSVALLLSECDSQIVNLKKNNYFCGPISEDLISKWKNLTSLTIPTSIDDFRKIENVFEIMSNNYKTNDESVSKKISS